MKPTNNFLRNGAKSTLMTLSTAAVAIVLTLVSCQKDDLLPEAVPDAAPEAALRAAPLRAPAGNPIVIDFEDPRVLSYLAGPTSYGANLYENYTGDDRYYGYDDEATGLYMMLNATGLWHNDYDFSNGGIAISQWNDTLTPCYINQCSVYSIDSGTGKGGHNGSNTFAVHFGYYDTITPYPYNMGDTRSYITFFDDSQTCVFNSFYVTNSTYAVWSMEYGDLCDTTFATRPLDEAHQDWFKVVIDGIGANGDVTGTVEFYLADFRTPTSPGIIKDWTQVNLSSLGHVTALRFDMQGSYHNEYGLVTPAYFCFDDLSVTLD